MAKPDKSDGPPQPGMDEVLKRMLSTPPKPHKEDKAKPADKTAQKKPAK